MSGSAFLAAVALLLLASVLGSCGQGNAGSGGIHWEVECAGDAFLTAYSERMFIASLSDASITVIASAEEWITLLESGHECKLVRKHKAEGLRSTVPPGYQSLQEIYNRLNATAATYPDIAAVVDMSAYPPGVSVLGNTMAVLKISDNVSSDEDEPNILINSEHHAREVVTPVIALYIIDQLTQGYDTQPKIKQYVDNNQIYVAPLWNPDGYDFMYEIDYNWRKNRAYNSDGSRGVDQNRNYDLGWNSTCGGSQIPSSDTYRGPSVASEPETQTMMSLSSGLNLNKQLDFHSYGREVLYGYDCTYMYPPLARFVEEEAIALAKQAAYDIRVPSADGEHPQWNTRDVGSYAYLVETAREFQPPYHEAIEEAERVWPLVEAFLERPPSVWGHITNEQSSDPLMASFTIRDTDTGEDLGIQRFSNSFGFYTLFLPSGNYSLSIDSDVGHSFVNFDLNSESMQLDISL